MKEIKLCQNRCSDNYMSERSAAIQHEKPELFAGQVYPVILKKGHKSLKSFSIWFEFSTHGATDVRFGAAVTMAKGWRDVVNKHGGDVTLIRLPEIGLNGNTHFPMSDLNNTEVANHLSEFLKAKQLD